jgi:hypothetical protein
MPKTRTMRRVEARCVEGASEAVEVARTQHTDHNRNNSYNDCNCNNNAKKKQ